MKTYQVYISETFSGYVDIDAESETEAYNIAVEQLKYCQINPAEDFDGDTFVEVEGEVE